MVYLKKCPFHHAGKALVSVRQSGKFTFYVECYGGCRGPKESSEGGAIREWNYRARPAAEELEGLEYLEALVSSCEAEFCSPATEGGGWVYGEDDDSDVAYPQSNITFGDILRAREVLNAIAKTAA